MRRSCVSGGTSIAAGAGGAASAGSAVTSNAPSEAGFVGRQRTQCLDMTTGAPAPNAGAAHERAPNAAALSATPSARRTACSTARSTGQRSRKRTSALAGCTFTSTSVRRNDEFEHERGPRPGGDRRAVAASAARTRPRVADRHGRSPRGRRGAPRCRRRPAARRAAHAHRAAHIVDLHEALRELRAPERRDARAQRRRRRGARAPSRRRAPR